MMWFLVILLISTKHEVHWAITPQPDKASCEYFVKNFKSEFGTATCIAVPDESRT